MISYSICAEERTGEWRGRAGDRAAGGISRAADHWSRSGPVISIRTFVKWFIRGKKPG